MFAWFYRRQPLKNVFRNCNTLQHLLFCGVFFSDCLYLKPVQVYNTVTNKTEPIFDIMGILERNQKELDYDRLVTCLSKVVSNFH